MLKKLPFLLLLGLSSTAIGVSDQSVPPGSAPEVAIEPADQVTQVRMDLPVSWQVTRARIRAEGASTESESFRETWSLEINRDGLSYLRSSRGESVIYIGPGKLSPTVPATIFIAEKDLATLVGLGDRMGELASQSPEDSQGDRMVSLSLVRRDNSDVTEIKLNFSPDEHYAVRLEIGDFSNL